VFVDCSVSITYQLTVDILIVDRCVYSFLLELIRKEEQIDLVVTLVCNISIADTEGIGSLPYCCHRLG